MSERLTNAGEELTRSFSAFVDLTSKLTSRNISALLHGAARFSTSFVLASVLAEQSAYFKTSSRHSFLRHPACPCMHLVSVYLCAIEQTQIHAQGPPVGTFRGHANLGGFRVFAPQIVYVPDLNHSPTRQKLLAMDPTTSDRPQTTGMEQLGLRHKY